jgi:hypothetical protein
MESESELFSVKYHNGKQSVAMTLAQFETVFNKLPQRGWKPDLSTLHRLPADTCVGVTCSADSGAKMFFGIETNGYAHT